MIGRRRRLWSVLAAVVVLGGCGSLGRPDVPPAIYDLAPQTSAIKRIDVPIADVDVISPSWLASSAIQYRLDPVSTLERRFYATSRWAGMPAEMLDVVLGRILQTQPAENGSGCRLRIDLDEFIQRFDAVDSSVGLIEMRASLLAPRTDVLLAFESFYVKRPAPTPDAAGGVVALREGATALGLQLADWLVHLETTPGSRANIMERCAR